MRDVHRSVALGTIVTVLAALALMGVSTASHAEESGPIPGFVLPQGVRDISSPDAGRATVAVSDEVVATVEDGSDLRVVHLETSTEVRARALASAIDSLPMVTAAVNQLVTGSTRVAGWTAAEAPSQDVRRVTAKSIPSVGSEEFGSDQWGSRAINVEAAWLQTRGSGVVVAVLDSGVDAYHSDLVGRVLEQIDFVSDDFYNEDPDGHGTHVAGIIAAAADGVGVVGVAPESTILPVRVLDAEGSGTTAWEIAGIQAAVDAGARVINMSLGSEGYSKAEHAVIRWAAKQGVTLVAAAGNEYQAGDPTEYPAAYPEVIAVAGVGQYDDGSLYTDPDSNTGTHIDVSAPSVDILSTVPESTGYTHDFKSGTSMASPHVAGVAALVRSANPALSKDAVDQILTSTARDLSSAGGWYYEYGFGLVQADQAVAAAVGAIGPIKSTVKAYSVSRGNHLKADVDPNVGSRAWKFRVQKLAADGTWRTLRGSYKTKTSLETATVKLKRGTYRVVVASRHGYAESMSGPVYLKK